MAMFPVSLCALACNHQGWSGCGASIERLMINWSVRRVERDGSQLEVSGLAWCSGTG